MLITLEQENTLAKVTLWALMIVALTFAIVILHSCVNQEPARAEEIDLGIIATIESGNNSLAVSPAGAVGMYQFMPIAWLDVQNNFPELRQCPFSCARKPQVAILFAKAYFVLIDRYLRHYGLVLSLENRLACYNQGIGLTKKGILSKESKKYILRYKKLAGAK